MDFKGPVFGGGTGGAKERGLSTAGTELFAHVFGDIETGVAAEDPGFELFYALQVWGEEVEIHAEEDVLHGEIGGKECDLHYFGFL